MQELFSTDGLNGRDRFERWRAICEDRLLPMKQQCLTDETFHATITGANVGELAFSKFALSNLRAETTAQSVRHANNKNDFLYLSLVVSGAVRSAQNDRATIDQVGDISIRDTNSPWTIEHRGYSEVIAIEIPRVRIEGLLGSARNFAGLTMNADLPATHLARTFLCNLLRVGDQLTPDTASRMSSTGIDLIVASIAERMALKAPKALYGTLIIQRAKAYVAANLTDPTLNPAQIAAAMGISLRRLQELFREDGRSVADWIWKRRLELAARRLADAMYVHVPLGLLAFACGFSDPAHFSRRFRGHFGLSPSDYRQAALTHPTGQP